MARFCTVGEEKVIPAPLLIMSLVAFGMVALALGFMLGSRPPEPLTASEAARILTQAQGWAGFTKVDTENGAIRHEVFCPNCGVEVAALGVVFRPRTDPAVGSPAGLWRSLAVGVGPRVASASPAAGGAVAGQR